MIIFWWGDLGCICKGHGTGMVEPDYRALESRSCRKQKKQKDKGSLLPVFDASVKFTFRFLAFM